jgi:hypothetical protein
MSMGARIFNLDDNERFVRSTSPVEAKIEELPAQAGFRGAISLPLLPDLIQIYTVSMADGALTIDRGTQTGTIWLEQGAIVHAVCGKKTGEEAVYELLRWEDGRFSLDTEARAPFHSIHASWQGVLMEGCRRIDEAAFASAGEELQVSAPSSSTEPLDDVCLAIEQALNGFLSVAILDRGDGSVLAHRSGANGISFRSVGPLIAEMLQRQSQAMASLGHPGSLQDSFSTLEDQVHLLEVLSESRVLYLAVKRGGVNLATVRRVVAHALSRLS